MDIEAAGFDTYEAAMEAAMDACDINNEVAYLSAFEIGRGDIVVVLKVHPSAAKAFRYADGLLAAEVQ